MSNKTVEKCPSCGYETNIPLYANIILPDCKQCGQSLRLCQNCTKMTGTCEECVCNSNLVFYMD